MLLRDHACLFLRRKDESDPYGVSFERYDLSGVMVFTKEAVGADGRNEGRGVIYFFPKRSRVKGEGGSTSLPEIRPGDYCASGKWGKSLSPVHDELGVCRRITSVTEYLTGSDRTQHIVIEAE
ncbi:MAG: hypothetical protein E7638_05860 [Ruminococcaceae bacterium]|nr:hypothetical protein [Oscillospiraceae bacterium]